MVNATQYAKKLAMAMSEYFYAMRGADDDESRDFNCGEYERIKMLYEAELARLMSDE